MNKNIYFISESVPHKGYGSFVIFYRHLCKLDSEGYSIHLVIPDYADVTDKYIGYKSWSIVKIPFKKWWFLFPYRYWNKLSRDVRFWLITNIYLKDYLHKHPPYFIITYFYGQFFNGLAVYIKKWVDCPLGVFLHDDKHLLNGTQLAELLKYDREIAENADVIWTVSKELIIPGTDNKKYKVLIPIPAGDSAFPIKEWNFEYKKPVVGFSGNIYEEFEQIFDTLATHLKKYEGELLLVINNPGNYNWLPALTERHPNITVIKSFPDAAQALTFLSENCSALFCGYPNALDQMQWIESCFPSKFVEFVHIGLPVILTSPIATALTNWAVENHWKLFTANYSDSAFDKIFTAITNEKQWQESANQSRLTADNLFNPDNIHNQFLNSITELA